MPKTPTVTVDGETVSTAKPAGILANDKNCVAMTFSCLMKTGVYPTINYFVMKGWISKASDLENDNQWSKVITGLGLEERYDKTGWAAVKTGMKGFPDGRYFACTHGKPGHAFAIIKHGNGIGLNANNQEKEDTSYHHSLKEDTSVSVWGPRH
jgi:hypothetical protein